MIESEFFATMMWKEVIEPNHCNLWSIWLEFGLAWEMSNTSSKTNLMFKLKT